MDEQAEMIFYSFHTLNKLHLPEMTATTSFLSPSSSSSSSSLYSSLSSISSTSSEASSFAISGALKSIQTANETFSTAGSALKASLPALLSNLSSQFASIQNQTGDLMRTVNNVSIISSAGNSSTSSSSKDDLDLFYRKLFTIAAYSLIIPVSLCGNLLVIKVIASRRKLQTTTNILIASLALADVLTTTLNIPFNVSRFLLFNYPFPALFCKLVPFIQVCCVYVSTLSMTVIAIHRYITLTNATSGSSGFAEKGHLASKRCGIIGSCFRGNAGGTSGNSRALWTIIALVWVLAAVLAIPHSVMFNEIKHISYHNVTYIRCRAEYPVWETMNFSLLLSVVAFLTQYLIPLSILCTLYIKIGFVVAKQGRIASKSDNKRRKEVDDARRRRIIMLALVVIVFALCWLPLNIYHLVIDFGLIPADFNIFLVCHWIAMSSVCYNPFIYCWLNESFRKGAMKMLAWLCFCCLSSPGPEINENGSQERKMLKKSKKRAGITSGTNSSESQLNSGNKTTDNNYRSSKNNNSNNHHNNNNNNNNNKDTNNNSTSTTIAITPPISVTGNGKRPSLKLPEPEQFTVMTDVGNVTIQKRDSLTDRSNGQSTIVPGRKNRSKFSKLKISSLRKSTSHKSSNRFLPSSSVISNKNVQTVPLESCGTSKTTATAMRGVAVGTVIKITESSVEQLPTNVCATMTITTNTNPRSTNEPINSHKLSESTKSTFV